MAYENEVELQVQGSIYVPNNEDNFERRLRIAYSIPRNGTNKGTGILCLIPAYGGNIDSNVYCKMRRDFADQYNLIVLQCDYFGIEYMSNFKDEIENYMQMYGFEKDIKTEISMNETPTYFNDMGLMQATDVVSMLLWFYRTAIEQKIIFNTERVIAYGSSHGSYLAYYVNRICPGGLKFIIDNSAYIYPAYLSKNRNLNYTIKNDKCQKKARFEINYFASKFANRLSNEFYDLKKLYQGFQNTCAVLSFQGTCDDMVSSDEKQQFIDMLGEHAALVDIGEKNVDGIIFGNANHGLGVNLVTLYDKVEQYMNFMQGQSLLLPSEVELKGEKENIQIIYKNLQPIIVRKGKENE